MVDDAMNTNFSLNDFYTRKLTSEGVLGDVYVKFATLKTAEEKFAYVFDLLKKRDFLTKLEEWPVLDITDELILSMRRAGNTYFSSKSYSQAIEFYNACVVHGDPDTEDYAFAVANRSAVFFRTDQYEYCLQDVRRALVAKYPVGKMYKLYERAGDAERLLGRYEDAVRDYNECLKFFAISRANRLSRDSFLPKIMAMIAECEAKCNVPDQASKTLNESSGRETTVVLLEGPHENIPALSKCLELKFTENMGRGVFASRDISPGDVVAIDSPYICGPYASSSFVCQYPNCWKFGLAIISCPHCTTIYCDEECMLKAAKEGHDIACPILKHIFLIPGSPRINKLVMEWFLKETRTLGLENYCLFVQKFMTTKVDPMTRGFDENCQYRSDSFLTTYALDSKESQMSLDMSFFLNCIAVEMVEVLLFDGFELPSNYLNIVGVSLVHMLSSVTTNYKKLLINLSSKLNLPFNNNELATEIGLYPSLLLFNHSCDANVRIKGIPKSKTCVLKAVQFIPRGEQLFISYGVNFFKHCSPLRKKYFKLCYKFNCVCQPCLENWPPHRFIPNRLSSLNFSNPENADTVSSECKKYMHFALTVRAEDKHRHLDYIYSFMKLLISNVKRPFALYEECLKTIIDIHQLREDEDYDKLWGDDE